MLKIPTEFNLLMNFFFVKFRQATGALAYQTYAHHILGAGGFLTAYYAPRTCLVFGCVSLSLEASTVFLNIRWFTFECGYNSELLGLINSGSLFISYIIVRIIG